MKTLFDKYFNFRSQESSTMDHSIKKPISGTADGLNTSMIKGVKIISVMGLIVTVIPAGIVFFFPEDFKLSSPYPFIDQLGSSVLWIVPVCYVFCILFVQRSIFLFAFVPLSMLQVSLIRVLRTYIRYEDFAQKTWLIELKRVYTFENKMWYITHYKSTETQRFSPKVIEELAKTSDSIASLNDAVKLEFQRLVEIDAQRLLWENSWTATILTTAKQAAPTLVLYAFYGAGMYILGRYISAWWSTGFFNTPVAGPGAGPGGGNNLNNVPVNGQDVIRINAEAVEVARGVANVQRQVDIMAERQVMHGGQIQQIHTIAVNQHRAIQYMEDAVQVIAGVPDLPNYPQLPPPSRPR